MADSEKESSDKKSSKKPVIPRGATEIQKMKLEKLMKDPDKTVSIPDLPKQWKPGEAPEFIRFVMGSSAGAGSGEFHVYRATRRREYNRVAYIDKMAEQNELNQSYHKKLEDNKAQAEERTAKKRAKRQRKKQKKMGAKRKKDETKQADGDSDQKQADSSEDDGDYENDEDDKPHFVIGGQ
ncbi:PRKR-interacting protein 1 homolog [Montipora foliosa]|uniref:PRKR-interacting protein 1 homolog n=1 Tax=Montipora foliosa TaxID=591990 RepID=UPI0035F21A30